MIFTRIDLSLIWLSHLSWSNVSLQRDSWSTSMITRCSPRVNRPTFVPLDETAIAAIHNDLIRAADADQVTALSSAFETVDDDIPLSVLERRFGVDGVALRWFQSYPQDRSQTFMVNGRSSRTHHVDCSVPQSSCLGPVEFITYTESVASVFGRHNINHHLFAGDKQSYAITPLEGVDDVHSRLRDCTTDISNWCASRRLQLSKN